MKDARVRAVCAVLLGLAGVNVWADPIPTSAFLGFFSPGEPADTAAEVGYINNLITLGAGAVGPITSFLSGPFDPSVANAAFVGETGSNVVSVTGYTYLLAKYGSGKNGKGGDYVWYVKGLTGAYVIPQEALSLIGSSKKGSGLVGLSHYTLFNRIASVPDDGTILTGSVPDGSTTLVLLSGALFGLEGVRRRFSA